MVNKIHIRKALSEPGDVSGFAIVQKQAFFPFSLLSEFQLCVTCLANFYLISFFRTNNMAPFIFNNFSKLEKLPNLGESARNKLEV